MSFTTAVVSRAGQVADQLNQMHKADKSALYGTPMSMAIYFCALEALAYIAFAYHATMAAVKIIPATVRCLVGWIPGCREVAEMIPEWLSMQTLMWTHLSGMAFSIVIAVMAPITTARDRASHKAESLRIAAKLLFTANIPVTPPKPISKVRQLMKVILLIPAVIAVSNPPIAIYLLHALFRRFKDGDWEGQSDQKGTAQTPQFPTTDFDGYEKCTFTQGDEKDKFEKLRQSCVAFDKKNPASIRAVLGKTALDNCAEVKKTCKELWLVYHPDKEIKHCSNKTDSAPFRCILEACDIAKEKLEC